MSRADFVIKHNPTTETPEDLGRKILKSIIINGRLKNHKPAIIFFGGESGEGKSLSALKFEEILFDVQGLDIRDFLHDVNVYTPLEYPEKLKGLLFDKRLKKPNILCLHEARDVIRAKNWSSFMAQAVADVNAQSRSIKRLCIIIISQFIRDITADMRYTLNYYITVRRPIGKRARLYINVMWKDDRDLEKPKLRKRRLSGYIVYPNGRYRRYIPQYIEISKPDKDIVEAFEKADREAKSIITQNKIEQLINDIKGEMGLDTDKILKMVDFYAKEENVNQIGRRYRGKWRLKDDFKVMHQLSDHETKRFEALLSARMGGNDGQREV